MLKILLIEDDPELVKMYKTAFKKSGCTLSVAGDGEKGLATARKEKPDLVLLDLVLPKLHGLGVLKEIKGDPKLKNIPVICLTVLYQDDEIKMARERGADGYFVKPDVSPDWVVSNVLRRLKRKKR